MRFKKILSIILAMLMMATILVGCGNGAKDEEGNAGDEAPKEVTITDQAGREVTVTGKYEKIVSGYYISTSMLVALGLEDNLVGIEAKAENRPIYKLAAPQLLDLPNVGTAKEFNLEGCIDLEPDLVILPKKLTDQAETLSDLGITVIVVNPENEQLLKEAVEIIATATGTTKRGNELLSYYENKYADLEGITKESDKNPRVYIAGTSDILTAASKAMYQNSVIEKAGGINVVSDIEEQNWSKISYEQLLAYNPDVIVIIPEAQFAKEDVLNDPELAELKAVTEGAVYEMPKAFEAWDSPVPSGVLGAMWLCSVINEDKYSLDDFKKEAAEFYKDFYDVEIDKALITK